MNEFITIKGAREHNLQNIDLQIPRDKMVVITGISGSGKSSLAFDTIYAEGQRRYMESLSSYARQFLGQMEKPDVDYIEGLSPAISIDQKTTSKNPRSTVGTVTEIYDYLRLLYARVGHPHCPQCGKPIERQTVDQIVDAVKALPAATKIQILAPLVRGRKGEYQKLFENAKKKGFVRVLVDGEMRSLDEEITLKKQVKHNISLVVDRLVIKEDMNRRLSDSLELALNEGEGLVEVEIIGKETRLFSRNFACPDCNVSIGEMTPRMFSFNNPFGACPTCDGLGFTMKIDPDFVIPDKNLSINEGAVVTMNIGNMSSWFYQCLAAVAKECGFSLDTPVKDLRQEDMRILLYGLPQNRRIKVVYEHHDGEKRTYHSSWEGLINNYERRYRETNSNYIREEFEKYMSFKPCTDCQGKRLKKESMAVTVGGLNITEVTDFSIREAVAFFQQLELTEREAFIAKQVLKEIKGRLRFLSDVGLDYMTLSRSSGTLSGGEAQRIRLATQIGSSLMGVLYILDEPSIGLHQRDNAKLIETLHHLRDIGNTVIVVEHDEETMRASDYIVDIGPAAGIHGGKVVACGTPQEMMEKEHSVTGDYLSGRKKIEVPEKRRPITERAIEIIGAEKNNLRKIDVKIPLGVFVAVTGVSGSGKSTLIDDILYHTLAHQLNRARISPENFAEIRGLQHLDKVIDIDQSPIGRTPRSNPATYTGVFDHIRDIFAETKEARARGYKKGRFSFNVKGGRCEACQGDGIIKIEMHFLPDIYVPCEVCKGKRYNRETLEATYKGKNIADILAMTVDEACDFFENIPKIYRKMKTLQDVGLGYIKLGQSATTLSGGEAQRVKLATELSRRSTGNTIYILDEPTTGLHSADIACLLDVLNRLVDGGDSVVVIEHNLDVIKTADYIIDLGPEGGNEGGTVIAQGTPEEVAKNKRSYTGQFLKAKLKENG
ncbi:MAG TPA: excinuclease ABC subunit UvrA [Clostridiales bacterium]|nr:excinuclease ABC subunit UvrA [Clostridiales bacterium]